MLDHIAAMSNKELADNFLTKITVGFINNNDTAYNDKNFIQGEVSVMARKKVGLWFYTNEHGDVIRSKIVKKLEEQDVEVIYDFDMRACYCLNGEVYTSDNDNLSKVDAFFFMNAEERNEHQNDMLRALEKSGVTVSNQVEPYSYANDKFIANVILRKSGVNVPRSMLIPTNFSTDKIQEIFRDWKAVVVKPRNKLGGNGIMKFNDFESFCDFYTFVEECVHNLYIEEYIPFKERDTRVEVFNGKVLGEGFSRLLTHSFKTNVKTGGKPIFIPADEDAKAMAVASANALGITATVVDLVRHSENGKPYVLEVNPFFGVFYGAYFESIGEVPPEHFTEFDQAKINVIVDHILSLISKDKS